MYLIFGKKIIDSKEVIELIEENSAFTVVKDMSKGSKREDIAAYNLSISIDLLNEEIKEMSDIETLSEDELFEEYMSLTEELSVEIEESLMEESVSVFSSYKWDKSDNDIKSIIVIAHQTVGERKVRDILKRLLSQCE